MGLENLLRVISSSMTLLHGGNIVSQLFWLLLLLGLPIVWFKVIDHLLNYFHEKELNLLREEDESRRTFAAMMDRRISNPFSDEIAEIDRMNRRGRENYDD